MTNETNKNKLGFSYMLNERNNEKLYSLNESVKEELSSIPHLKAFKEVEFEVQGVYSENNLKLVCNYTLENDKTGTKEFSSHVDVGAIELYESTITAFWGEEKYNEVKDLLEEHLGTFEGDYLKDNEEDAFNQLAEEYVLQCSPDSLNGAEFTKDDQKFFEDILKEENMIKSFVLTYETEHLSMEDIDKIHKDMLGTVGGDKLDVEVEDISFNDDETCHFVGHVSYKFLEDRELSDVENFVCETLEEADQNLHKFLKSYQRFDWQ